MTAVIEHEFSVLLKGREWTCKWQRSPRRTIILQLVDKYTLLAKTPVRYSKKKLQEWIYQKEKWIYTQLAKLEKAGEKLPLPEFYRTGAIQRFMGKAYSVEWVRCPPREKKVILSEDRLWILAPTNEVKLLQRLLTDWYRTQAKPILQKEIDDWSSILPWVRQTPSFMLRNVHSQWGSCSPQGTLSFNIHLVKFPLEIISYIVCHELCHLQEMNHGANFYALLDLYMPEWKRYRTFLKKFTETNLILF